MKNAKTIARFAAVGFAVSVVVFLLGFWENHARTQVSSRMDGLIQYLSLILCPPSIGLMAADRATRLGLVFIMIIIAAENAALYALAGALFIWVRRRIQKDR